MTTVAPHLSELRSLDLGQETGPGLPLWDVACLQFPLTFLRLPVQHIRELCRVFSAGTLASTLRQLHVTMRSLDQGANDQEFDAECRLPTLTNLHTFVMAQSIYSMNQIPWSIIETLTATDVMPALRRANLVVLTTLGAVNAINQSALFGDEREIDVQFVLVLQDACSGAQLRERIPHGSRSHPRPVAGAKCTFKDRNRQHQQLTDPACYVSLVAFSLL